LSGGGQAAWGVDTSRGRLRLQDAVFILRTMAQVKTVSSQKRRKTAQVNLRVDPALKAAAEKAAVDDQRSLTSLVEKLLTDYLKRKRALP
jgi:hypothetical protein